jgi:hypothetical protein
MAPKLISLMFTTSRGERLLRVPSPIVSAGVACFSHSCTETARSRRIAPGSFML